MNLRNLLVAGMAVLVLVLFAGCQPSSSGGGSSNAGDANAPPDADANTGDDANAQGDPDAGGDATVDDNANATDQDDDSQEDDEATLTEEEAEAVDTAVDATQDLAGLFAAIAAGELPSSDEPILVNPNPFSDCPTLAVAQGTLTIDYGDGCNPVLYPESTFAGSMTVEVNLTAQTMTITFNDLVVDEETINGTAEAEVSREGDTLTLVTDIEVIFTSDEYEVTYIGDVTVEIDLATGEIFIPEADLEAIDQTGDTYAIILDDVHIDLVEVLPDSGTATIILGTEDEFPLTVVIRFTEDTPTNGTVYVSVNGSPEVRMSLEDVDVEDVE